MAISYIYSLQVDIIGASFCALTVLQLSKGQAGYNQTKFASQFPVACFTQCIYNQIKMNYSEEIVFAEQVAPIQAHKALARDYKCPCGKTYLSYAALFTHIKQKHQGKAPGQIQKPKVESKPRGRPPLSTKNKLISLEKDIESTKDNLNSFKTMEDIQKNQIYWGLYFQIFAHLKHLHTAEEIGLKIWDQVNSFKNFQEFIDTNQQKKTVFQGVNIGFGLSEFLKSVSLQTEPWRFEQVLILFMLLLQYIIDQTNNQNIISEAPVQILIQYMNPFLNYHIEDFAEHLNIQSLWIMDKNNIHNIFLCFYNWLKWKEYTQFCITLLD